MLIFYACLRDRFRSIKENLLSLKFVNLLNEHETSNSIYHL